MIISYRHQFIFVHNWKVAGTSLRAALMPFACEQPTRSGLINLMMDRDFHVGYQLNSLVTRSRATNWLSKLPSLAPFEKHNTASSLRAQLPSRIWTQYFKFGFVRNPWAREVSNYEFIRQRRIRPAFEAIEHLSGFDEYVDRYVRLNSYPQRRFFTDDLGEIIVDYVGRFESLADDFVQITAKIGIKAKLPHLNTTKHRCYREYYSEMSRQAIGDIYAEDIELFGYTF